jgi:hypothetical protein
MTIRIIATHLALCLCAFALGVVVSTAVGIALERKKWNLHPNRRWNIEWTLFPFVLVPLGIARNLADGTLSKLPGFWNHYLTSTTWHIGKLFLSVAVLILLQIQKPRSVASAADAPLLGLIGILLYLLPVDAFVPLLHGDRSFTLPDWQWAKHFLIYTGGLAISVLAFRCLLRSMVSAWPWIFLIVGISSVAQNAYAVSLLYVLAIGAGFVMTGFRPLNWKPTLGPIFFLGNVLFACVISSAWWTSRVNSVNVGAYALHLLPMFVNFIPWLYQRVERQSLFDLIRARGASDRHLLTGFVVAQAMCSVASCVLTRQ